MNTRFEEFSDLGFQLGNEDDVNLIFRLEMNEPPTRCLILIQDKSLFADLAVEDLVVADLVVANLVVADRSAVDRVTVDRVTVDRVADLVVSDRVVADLVVVDRVAVLHFSLIDKVTEWKSELVELTKPLLVNFPVDQQRERHVRVCNGVDKSGFDQLKYETSKKLLILQY
jgi:hypothetical protein